MDRAWLREQEGLSQVDLADVLELQPISLVRLLDCLVEHGLSAVPIRGPPSQQAVPDQTGRRLVDDLDSLRDAIATDVLRDIPPRRSVPASTRSGYQGPHQGRQRKS
jgi:hypothetical protein